jgi:hypothetical protein
VDGVPPGVPLIAAWAGIAVVAIEAAINIINIAVAVFALFSNCIFLFPPLICEQPLRFFLHLSLFHY